MTFNKYYSTTSNDYYQTGRDRMDEGDYNSAIEDFTNAIALAEESSLSLLYGLRAECYERMKQYDKAIIDEPRISCFLMMNQVDEALNMCNAYIKAYSEKNFGYVQRANCYKKMKEYEKAIADYTTAIDLISYEYSEEYEEFYHLRALCYQEMKQYDNALKDHSEAIKRNRRHKGVYPDIYFQYRAEYYKEIGEQKKADADYERAINNYTKELEGKITNKYYYEHERRSEEETLLARANCYKSMERYSRAIEDYTKLIETKIHNLKEVKYRNIAIVYYSGRGDCYKQLKQYDKALQDYTSAIELSNYNDENYIKRASCYQELKNYEKAVCDYTKAIEIYPYEWKYYYDRAKCFFELGEFNKMREDYNYLLFNPENKLYNVNTEECELLNKKLKSISNKPIEIATCTKREIMSIEGITSSIADKFIEKRNNGAMWYSIEAFARDFKIESYQIQNRLIFPLKQGARMGRKLDI